MDRLELVARTERAAEVEALAGRHQLACEDALEALHVLRQDSASAGRTTRTGRISVILVRAIPLPDPHRARSEVAGRWRSGDRKMTVREPARRARKENVGRLRCGPRGRGPLPRRSRRLLATPWPLPRWEATLLYRCPMVLVSVFRSSESLLAFRGSIV